MNETIIKKAELNWFVIYQRYQKGEHIDTLAKELGIHKKTIYRRFKLNNFVTNRQRKHLLNWNSIKDEYLNGKSLVVLAEKYKCSYVFISHKLKNNGVQIRNPHAKGELSHHWQNGKHKDGQGRIHISNSTFKYEHQKIYAEANNLAEIPKNYCVHHLDHDASNNKVSNLLLMLSTKHHTYHSYKRWGNKIKADELIAEAYNNNNEDENDKARI